MHHRHLTVACTLGGEDCDELEPVLLGRLVWPGPPDYRTGLVRTWSGAGPVLARASY
ncbi:hypothetical protein Psta_1147 [Pirellula staleyi DSM 6068]|uniref:Uncharacterized protein n=1 Tax=Pirellula staleyi (strain ATCC 27377 / DSM 6068 / ICPB 4128) TaxID=530564 RepID=D2R902_PIRSD|nr:hypothetical protein Psta_1147 [Pirellula staleyi DSM 6068]